MRILLHAFHLHFAFETQSRRHSLYLCVHSVLKFDVGGIKAKPQAGKSPALSGKSDARYSTTVSWQLEERHDAAPERRKL